MKYPAYIKNCIERLSGAGFSAYAVGGAVRDSLLGRKAHDWDVTTSATPEETLKVFWDMKTVPTGLKHGTVSIIYKSEDGENIPVEITTFRIDGEYRDFRHPSCVTFADRIEDDLSRRDFTVNAMAYSDERGLVDPFGGKADAEKKVIRCVGDPEKRFSEDALRIMRAFRFSAQLGFSIEENTLAAAEQCGHLLSKIARERVGSEFLKLLSAKDPSYSLELMIKHGIFSAAFPDFEAPQERVLSLLPLLEQAVPLSRLSAIILYYDEKQKTDFLDSLRSSNEQKKYVLRLCRAALFLNKKENERAVSGPVARRFLSLFSDISEPALEIMSVFAPDPDTAKKFSAEVREEKSKYPCVRVRDLVVTGNDLASIFGDDKSKIGKALTALLSYVIEDPEKNEKEALLSYCKELFKK